MITEQVLVDGARCHTQVLQSPGFYSLQWTAALLCSSSLSFGFLVCKVGVTVMSIPRYLHRARPVNVRSSYLCFRKGRKDKKYILFPLSPVSGPDSLLCSCLQGAPPMCPPGASTAPVLRISPSHTGQGF